MRCQLCGLPDPYRSHGDGIGSCDCTRCECCGAGPDECECGRDWDDMKTFLDEDEIAEMESEWLCNDWACDHRRARADRRRQQAATSDGATQ